MTETILILLSVFMQLVYVYRKWLFYRNIDVCYLKDLQLIMNQLNL